MAQEHDHGSEGAFPPSFDPIYFMDESWEVRVQRWQQDALQQGFSSGNHAVIEQALREPEAGLRIVVNISSAALLSFLRSGRYLNLYDEPVIGSSTHGPTKNRREVDEKLDIDGHRTYFGAVALGGVGVRYYGEYCMVLRLGLARDDTRLFDRDSYDILLPPLVGVLVDQPLIERLRGTWGTDLYPMVLLKVLPEVVHLRRLVTSGTVSEAILKDQEFIEVHLELEDPFSPGDVEEIRESPDEVAVEARLRERQGAGLFVSAVEQEWLRQREMVATQLDAVGVRSRVVTLHGRGYQWR